MAFSYGLCMQAQVAVQVGRVEWNYLLAFKSRTLLCLTGGCDASAVASAVRFEVPVCCRRCCAPGYCGASGRNDGEAKEGAALGKAPLRATALRFLDPVTGAGISATSG